MIKTVTQCWKIHYYCDFIKTFLAQYLSTLLTEGWPCWHFFLTPRFFCSKYISSGKRWPLSEQDGTFVPTLPARQGDCVVLCYDAIRRDTIRATTPVCFYTMVTSHRHYVQSRLRVHLKLKRKNCPNNNNKVVFRPGEHEVLAGDPTYIWYIFITILIPLADWHLWNEKRRETPKQFSIFVLLFWLWHI